jgi:hypothetical protein
MGGMGEDRNLDWDSIMKRGLKAQGLGFLEKVPRWAKVGVLVGALGIGLFFLLSE